MVTTGVPVEHSERAPFDALLTKPFTMAQVDEIMRNVQRVA